MIKPTKNAPFQVAEITGRLGTLRIIAADSTMTEAQKVADIKRRTTEVMSMIEANEAHWLKIARQK